MTTLEKALFKEIGWMIITRAIGEVSANTNGWKDAYKVTYVLESMRENLRYL